MNRSVRVVGVAEGKAIAAVAVVRDPVCGRQVELGYGALRTDYAGSRYYFCTSACRSQFHREPESYVPAADSEA